MKWKTKYKLVLYKTYFDKGYALTTYFKYLIILFGFYTVLTDIDFQFVIGIALLYGFACFFIGWYWLRGDWYKAEIEVGNRYNLFVKEMRKRFK